MATAIPGIMIKSISGRIGNIVFYSRRGVQCARTHVIPRNPDTEAQKIIRLAFREAVLAWQKLSDDEKYTYNRKARYMSMSGYNLYISAYIKTKISGEVIINTASAYNVIDQSTPSLNRIHSVSTPNTVLSGINIHSKSKKPHPG